MFGIIVEPVPVPLQSVFPVPGNISKFLLDPIPNIPEFIPGDELTCNYMEMDIAVFLLFCPPDIILHVPAFTHFDNKLIQELRLDDLIRMNLFT
jgi:hypothetical protein